MQAQGHFELDLLCVATYIVHRSIGVSMLQPTLGVSSLTWAALRSGPSLGRTTISRPFAGWPAVRVACCSYRLKETHMSAPLLSLVEDTALLALEAQTVIGIRLTQLSLGGGRVPGIGVGEPVLDWVRG